MLYYFNCFFVWFLCGYFIHEIIYLSQNVIIKHTRDIITNKTNKICYVFVVKFAELLKCRYQGVLVTRTILVILNNKYLSIYKLLIYLLVDLS